MAGIRTRVTGWSKELELMELPIRRHRHRRKESVKSGGVSLQTRNNVKKAEEAARASVDEARWFSAKSRGVAKECYVSLCR